LEASLRGEGGGVEMGGKRMKGMKVEETLMVDDSVAEELLNFEGQLRELGVEINEGLKGGRDRRIDALGAIMQTALDFA